MGLSRPILKLVKANSSLVLAGKLVFWELLEEGFSEKNHESYTGGLHQVFIVDRNQVVIDDLNDIIEQEPQMKNVSIVYGEGHMPNFEMRLKERVCQETSVTWIDAITVQLPKNAMKKMKLELAQNVIR